MNHSRYEGTEARRHNGKARGTIVCLGLCCALGLTARAAQAQANLNVYPTKYYELHTDLDEDGVREATLRITLMAEEYASRTKGLAGMVRDRLPFFLFKNRRDYEAAGGMPGSAGVFTGSCLVAVANPQHPDATWHTVQHEGFHQFVHAAIGEGLPTWANEGMAEYFGEGVFAGDEFIVGVIPAGRAARIKAGLAERRYASMREMMTMPNETWVLELKKENYDQAWAMVQFLAHADGGKYQEPFMGFLRDVSKKLRAEQAWQRNFGNDVAAFQRRWSEYWSTLPEDPTLDLYAQAITSTLTSFYARAISQRQRFDTMDAFFEAASAGRLKAAKQDWLPPSLLSDALKYAPQVGEWSLARRSGPLAPVCRMADGTVIEGSFAVDGNRVKRVTTALRKK